VTEPYWEGDGVKVLHGNCVDALQAMPGASVDAIVTDPPYGLDFMGKDWDRPWAVGASAPGYRDATRLARPTFGDSRNANCRICGGRQRGARRCGCDKPDWDRHPREDMLALQAWCTEWATECLRVLRPGGHMLAFGGTRTSHRLVCAIEDAGFEIRDTITWHYGNGFPKSLDVSKAIDKRKAVPEAARWQGWGTALKPATELIVVARKPLAGTVAASVLTHGTGALNIDGCRVAHASENDRRESEAASSHPNSGGGPRRNRVFGTDDRSRDEIGNYQAPLGRWPANLVMTHSHDCGPDDAPVPCVEGCPVTEVDRQSGDRKAGSAKSGREPQAAAFSGNLYGAAAREGVAFAGYNDSGGASRFFPAFRWQAKARKAERPVVGGVMHPTVKPLALMRWLVRLVTPPGGLVLDPFAGSGTTGEACAIEGFQCVLVEREAAYLPLIVARMEKTDARCPA
jgi:DNA modification methylase